MVSRSREGISGEVIAIDSWGNDLKCISRKLPQSSVSARNLALWCIQLAIPSGVADCLQIQNLGILCLCIQ